MPFTTDELAAVEKAIATGATRVKYADKEVEYRSLSELYNLREQIKDELGLNGTLQNKGRRYASFDKGIK